MRKLLGVKFMAALPSETLGTRVPRKAKNILDRLVAGRQMTTAGMEWLIAATDPFHDDRVRCPGYPDMNTVNSVVQTYTTTQNVMISGATAPWDMHCCFIPASATSIPVNNGTYPLLPYRFTTNGTYYGTAPTTPGLLPGWNIIACATSGDDWYSPSGTVTNFPGVHIPAKFCSGHFRLVSAGIECVNTTAELYKGGSLTVYRAPSSEEDTVLQYITATSVAGPTSTGPVLQKRVSEKELPVTPDVVQTYMKMPYRAVALPPTTQLEAATYTDSRTWSAVDGAYVIATQNNMDNPYQTLAPSDIMVKKCFDSGTLAGDAFTGTPRPTWISTSNVPFFNTGQPNTGSAMKIFPFDTCGLIAAGLNQNSTMQITVRYYFERIPATTEPDLLAMAQVPPAFDGMAMEIYSRCLAEMPVGVPQNENPLGEWFSSVLDGIKSIAPKLGGIISGVGRAIGEIGGVPPVQSNATAQKDMTKAQKKRLQNNSRKSGPNHGKRVNKGPKIQTGRAKGPKRRPPTRK